MLLSFVSINKTLFRTFHSSPSYQFSKSSPIQHKIKPFQKSLHLHARSKKSNYDAIKYMSPLYKPRTDNQLQYVQYLNDKSIPIVLGIGPAGSGKTLFACNQAVSALKSGSVSKIILTRPVVSVEEDIGFLPGSLIHKMDPWTRPIFDILLEFYQQKDIDGMLHGGVLEISPLGYMRGRTFKNAFIIADEMQNSSPNQMLMLTTRIGEGSKMVITGDLKQSDRGTENGLADLMQKIKKYNHYCLGTNSTLPAIRMVEMQGTDIQRSPIVSTLLDIYAAKPFTHSFPNTSFQNTTSYNPLIETETSNGYKRVSNHTNSNYDAALIPISHYQVYSKYLLE
jgi:phosphate starvation-inducible PhoH-like protein